MAGQSRIGSAVEAVAGVTIGLGLSFVANLVVLPLFGFAVTTSDAAGIGAIFTVLSLARTYLVRRLFNRIFRHG